MLQGSRSLTGSPGEPRSRDREPGWELQMLFEKSLWRSRVLGQMGCPGKCWGRICKSIFIPCLQCWGARGVQEWISHLQHPHGPWRAGGQLHLQLLLEAQRSKINFCWQKILTILIEDHYRSEIFSFEGRDQTKMFKAFHMC